jgi:hypothetical protein
LFSELWPEAIPSSSQGLKGFPLPEFPGDGGFADHSPFFVKVDGRKEFVGGHNQVLSPSLFPPLARFLVHQSENAVADLLSLAEQSLLVLKPHVSHINVVVHIVEPALQMVFVLNLPILIQPHPPDADGGGAACGACGDVVLPFVAGRDAQASAWINAVAPERLVHLRGDPNPPVPAVHPGAEGFRFIAKMVVKDHFLSGGRGGREESPDLIVQRQPSLIVVPGPKSESDVGWVIFTPDFQVFLRAGDGRFFYSFPLLLFSGLSSADRCDPFREHNLGRETGWGKRWAGDESVPGLCRCPPALQIYHCRVCRQRPTQGKSVQVIFRAAVIFQPPRHPDQFFGGMRNGFASSWGFFLCDPFQHFLENSLIYSGEHLL